MNRRGLFLGAFTLPFVPMVSEAANTKIDIVPSLDAINILLDVDLAGFAYKFNDRCTRELVTDFNVVYKDYGKIIPLGLEDPKTFMYNAFDIVLYGHYRLTKEHPFAERHHNHNGSYSKYNHSEIVWMPERDKTIILFRMIEPLGHHKTNQAHIYSVPIGGYPVYNKTPNTLALDEVLQNNYSQHLNFV